MLIIENQMDGVDSTALYSSIKGFPVMFYLPGSRESIGSIGLQDQIFNQQTYRQGLA